MGAREQALAKRHLRNNSDQTRRELLPLATGDLVSIQNQYGNKAKKWGRTGRIVEALPNRQYQVVVDGSRHVTLRNRKFLRKIDPICRQPQPTFTTTNAVPFPILTPQRVQEPNPEGHSDRLPTPPSTSSPREATSPVMPQTVPIPSEISSPPTSAIQPIQQQQTTPLITPQPVRRSNRSNKGVPPTRLDL